MPWTTKGPCIFLKRNNIREYGITKNQVMKFKKLKIENNIRSYDTLNNNLILVSNNKVHFNDILLLEDNDYNVGYFANTNFAIFGNNRKMIRLDIAKNNRELINSEWSYYWRTLNENTVLISSRNRGLCPHRTNKRRMKSNVQSPISPLVMS